MAKSKTKAPKPDDLGALSQAPARATRKQTMIDLMRREGGATAAELGAAVAWQVHSVRGFIAGTLKKQSDLIVEAQRIDGVTRYSVTDRAVVEA